MIEIRHVDNAETGQAYDTIYAGHGINHPASLYLYVLDMLYPRPGTRLLDVSCGEGAFVHHASRRGLDAVGLDLSRAAVQRAAATIPGACFVVGDGERLPFPDGSFDYVTCIGSLEHFANPVGGAAEIARVLKQDGLALVLVPNTFGLTWTNLHAWRTGELSDDGQPLQRYGTRGQWLRLLQEAGLVVGAVRKYERPLPRTWDDLRWYLKRPIKLFVSLVVYPLIPVNLSHSLIYMCGKAAAAHLCQLVGHVCAATGCPLATSGTVRGQVEKSVDSRPGKK